MTSHKGCVHQVFPWTDEQIAELRRLHAEGFPASVICEKLGAPSREAVRGKLWRLGLKGVENPGGRPPKTRAERGGGFAVALRSIDRWTKSPGVEALPERAPEVIGPAAVVIVELRSGVCRRPLWGLEALSVEEKFYCGEGSAGLYCERHSARARA